MNPIIISHLITEDPDISNTLFHGTDNSHVDFILKNGLIQNPPDRKTGYEGEGIFLGPPELALAYATDMNGDGYINLLEIDTSSLNCEQDKCMLTGHLGSIKVLQNIPPENIIGIYKFSVPDPDHEFRTVCTKVIKRGSINKGDVLYSKHHDIT